MLRRANQRLAAHAGVRQVEAVLRADAAAEAADRAVRAFWRRVLPLTRLAPHEAHGAGVRAGWLLALLRQEATLAVGWKLLTLAQDTYRQAAKTAAQVLPLDALAAAVVMNARGGLREDVTVADLLAPIRDHEYSREELAGLIFDPPTDEFARAIIYATGWQDRIASGTKLGQPEKIAAVLAGGIAAGRTRQELVRDLTPLVDGVRSSARRIARTEGLRVATEAQLAAHQQFGDLVIGYQIHATLDENTRPEHAARNGTVYWVRPKAGQFGLDAMPRPPREPDGTTAWNCRCYLTPVLANPGTTLPHDASLEPDPATYSEWFGRADERRRRLAVGTRRYGLVQDLVGRAPTWADFLDPDTGRLLTQAELRAESEAARLARVERARKLIAERGLDLRRASQAGTLSS